MNLIRRIKQWKINRDLKSIGYEYRKTALGEPVFIKEGADSAHNGFWGGRWSEKELKTFLAYMQNNRDCTIYSDGSGEAWK